MSYTNGNEYIIKSMNGIKTFDDGSGILIGNGTITTSDMTTSSITTSDITCNSLLTVPAIATNYIGSDTIITLNSPLTTNYDLSVLTKTSSENSTKAASTAFVNTAITNLKSASNTWTGTQDFTGSTMITSTKASSDNSTAPATTAFVGTAITNLKSASNTWTGTQNFTGSTITVPMRKHPHCW